MGSLVRQILRVDYPETALQVKSGSEIRVTDACGSGCIEYTVYGAKTRFLLVNEFRLPLKKLKFLTENLNF